MFTLVALGSLLLSVQIILAADGGEKAYDGRGCWYTEAGLKLPEDQMEVIPGLTDVVECKKFCEGYDGDAACYVLQVANGVCSRNKNAEANWDAVMRDQTDSTQYHLASCGDEKDDVPKEDDAAEKEDA
ncbi:hypothetical protein HELRODRAFT_160811 [Helobdella robusta]|uniref:Apple domain-containing protein n=1 Tax=Helobdella robusta TaxID=6412 RepID=T1EQR3_HELRO|nr:hypothetical protein HELRODRAFT_160811 [Helobdella robusta]ESO06621.1 hypothetical protein HELRODRAFT_160811 [Helobdella robusta]